MENKEYIIEITETLCKEVIVIADNENDARDRVKEAYYNGEIVLDSSDFLSVEFPTRENEE